MELQNGLAVSYFAYEMTVRLELENALSMGWRGRGVEIVLVAIALLCVRPEGFGSTFFGMTGLEIHASWLCMPHWVRICFCMNKCRRRVAMEALFCGKVELEL